MMAEMSDGVKGPTKPTASVGFHLLDESHTRRGSITWETTLGFVELELILKYSSIEHWWKFNYYDK